MEVKFKNFDGSNLDHTLVGHLFGKSQDAISDINTLVLDLVDVGILSLPRHNKLPMNLIICMYFLTTY